MNYEIKTATVNLVTPEEVKALVGMARVILELTPAQIDSAWCKATQIQIAPPQRVADMKLLADQLKDLHP